MREIKFRAWDSEKREMFFPSSISFKGNSVWACDVHGENRYEYELVKGNAHLMQFTGLRDKNGREIYEGDIVKNSSGLDLIEWVEGAGGFMFEQCDADGCEVVGNSHENPDLIKKEA